MRVLVLLASSCMVFAVLDMFAVYASYGKLSIHVTAWDENLEVAQMADELK